MARVSALDYKGILEVVSLVAGGAAADPMPRPALTAMRHLIPCDVVAYFEGPPWDRLHRRVWVDGDYTPWTLEEKAILDRFRFQIPIWPTPATIGGALAITDGMSQQAYRNTELYQLVGRKHSVEYSLTYWMSGPDGVVRGLAFDASHHDFRAREKAVLEVLGRHLGPILGRDDPRLPRSSAALGITPRQAMVLALVAQGRTNAQIAAVLSLSPNTVRKHLENAYGRMNVHSRSEAIATAYRASQSARARGESLI